jgi:hypothetical protein
MIYANGDKYEGSWLNNRAEGKGSMIFANGDRYDGMWSGGKQEGKGVMVYANGDRYEGIWQVSMCDLMNFFDLNHQHAKHEGKGSLHFANGDRYDGEWKNDKMHGHGIYVRSDSMKLEAQFEDGFRYYKTRKFQNLCYYTFKFL